LRRYSIKNERARPYSKQMKKEAVSYASRGLAFSIIQGGGGGGSGVVPPCLLSSFQRETRECRPKGGKKVESKGVGEKELKYQKRQWGGRLPTLFAFPGYLPR